MLISCRVFVDSASSYSVAVMLLHTPTRRQPCCVCLGSPAGTDLYMGCPSCHAQHCCSKAAIPDLTHKLQHVIEVPWSQPNQHVASASCSLLCNIWTGRLAVQRHSFQAVQVMAQLVAMLKRTPLFFGLKCSKLRCRCTLHVYCWLLRVQGLSVAPCNHS